MERLFSKRALARLREFNRFEVSSQLSPAVEVLWFQVYSSEQARKIKPNLNMHRHTFYEIHFVLEGTVSYITKSGDTFTANGGGYICIPPEAEHQLKYESATLKKSVLTFSVLDTVSGQYSFPSKISCVKDCDWVQNIFAILGTALESDNGIAAQILKNTVSTMILFIADRVEEADAVAATTQKDERIVKAKMFIADNSIRNISVQEVAYFVYLSVKQLERLFVEYEHIKVSEYIAKARCDAAKLMLARDDLSVEQVAEQLCFSNLYNFNRFFKRIEGITPGVYKKIKNNQGE